MGFMDKFRGNKQSATLPRGAKVARRQRRRGGGADTGYWYNSQFFLLDGTLCGSNDYLSGEGYVLGTSEARNELSDAGYQSDSYTTPSTSSSSYDSGSSSSSGSSYSGGGSSYDSGSSYGGSSSYDGGYTSSGGSSYGGSSGGSSYDSGSSSSSSSSDSGSSW